MQKHRMISKDTEALTGVCSICGPVALHKKSRPNSVGYVCFNARRSQETFKYFMNDGSTIRLTRGKRDAIIAQFPPGCNICGRTGVQLKLDHCHKTGKWRGMLCHTCNVYLGYLGDNSDAFRKIAEYLEKDRPFLA